MTLLVFYVLLALGVSFLCSIMEAVILSVTPSFVATLEQRGNPLGKRLKAFKSDIDRPLSAILSLNTIAHTVGAAGAGAQAAIVFTSVPIGVISGILTLLILIFSEIIPKTLGAMYWRSMAGFVTSVLGPTILLMAPLVWLSQGITRLLSRNRKKETFSREEFTALAELGKQQGVFEESESRILKNLFLFASLTVKDIMTPRIVVFALPQQQTLDEVLAAHQEFRFSRIPVYNANRDDIQGYVLKDHILLNKAQGKGSMTLEELTRDLTVVPATLKLMPLFERLLNRSDQIALVVDEYGGFAGIVTMEDIVETLLGMEIMDEEDRTRDMQELARQQWLNRARRLGIVDEDLHELDPDPAPKEKPDNEDSVS